MMRPSRLPLRQLVSWKCNKKREGIEPMRTGWLALLLGVFAALTACSENTSLEDRIADWYETSCGDERTCELELRKLTSVEWDRLFVFWYGARQKEVEQILGIDNYPDFQELSRRIVLMRDGRIVHQEQHASDPERVLPGEVVFDLGDSKPYSVYSARDARFNVKRVKTEGGWFFELHVVAH